MVDPPSGLPDATEAPIKSAGGVGSARWMVHAFGYVITQTSGGRCGCARDGVRRGGAGGFGKQGRQEKKQSKLIKLVHEPKFAYRN